jgi:hypothetical protein
MGRSCAQVSTPTESSIPSPTASVESTPPFPSGWDTYTSQGQCGYAISHPADMQGASQDMYSWILSPSLTEPSGPVPNFVYVSVIPDEFRNGGDEIIYNYNPAEAETLLNMQVGESKPLRDDPNTAHGSPTFACRIRSLIPTPLRRMKTPSRGNFPRVQINREPSTKSFSTRSFPRFA